MTSAVKSGLLEPPLHSMTEVPSRVFIFIPACPIHASVTPLADQMFQRLSWHFFLATIVILKSCGEVFAQMLNFSRRCSATRTEPPFTLNARPGSLSSLADIRRSRSEYSPGARSMRCIATTVSPSKSIGWPFDSINRSARFFITQYPGLRKGSTLACSCGQRGTNSDPPSLFGIGS